MKKIFFVVVFCGSISNLWAQAPSEDVPCIPEPSSQTESAALRTPTKDMEKMNNLNVQTNQLLNKNLYGDVDFAKKLNAEALSLARSIHYRWGIGEALYNKGLIIQKSQDPQKQQKSLTIFLEALSYLCRDKTSKKLALCLRNISNCYHHMGKLDEAIAYADSTEQVYLKLKDTISYLNTYAYKGHCFFDKGDYKTAYEIGMNALKMAERSGDTASNVYTLTHIANLFLGAGLPAKSLKYVNDILQFYPNTFNKSEKIDPTLVWLLIIAGEAYLKMNKIDSAFFVTRIIPEDNSDNDYPLLYGRLHVVQKQYDKALEYFRKGLQSTRMAGLEISHSRYANEMGLTYLKLNKIDSAVFHARNALNIAEAIPALLEMKNAVSTLMDIYASKNNYERVYHYGQRYKALNDSLAPEEYRQKLALVQVQNELENQKQHAVVLSQQNKIKEQQLSKEGMMKNFLIAGMGFLLLFGAFVVRANRKQQQANNLLKEQKEEVQKALIDLKAAQEHLVQREKMASLGELTAGIAHEIQNPLNFVNNFSEVSNELLDEMQAELTEGNTSEALLIATDVKQNLSKINHHGKRADAIVKSMLQHSRKTSGSKEPTDLNALVDEYLRLSYHGLRAKDKNFNTILETHYDPSVGNVNIVSQDVGRVLLNLFNNAFYSVTKKKAEEGKKYEPTVIVRTINKKDVVEVYVKDNGTGIPQNVLDKIYQPFFTTKPTGEGTGLGLSLSYDIITKGHGGEMKVETKEGEGAEFIINIPLKYSNV